MVDGFDSKQKLVATLKQICMFFLQELCDKEILDILRLRSVCSFFNMEDFYALDECDDVLSKDYQKQACRRVKDYRSLKLTTDEFTEDWLEYNRKVHKLPGRANPDPNSKASPLYRIKCLRELPKDFILQLSVC